MATETELRGFGRLICGIADGKLMKRKESKEAYRQVILNIQPELQQGAFLMAHITRGPTVEELAGAWDALDQYDTKKIDVNIEGFVCDIVGTGSDPLKTVNCSTPATFIASGAGLCIAKKGARLVTGVSGASDVLEVLGIDLNAPLENAKKCLEKYKICYLPGEAFLKSGWARLIKSMRFTSAFNIIGPLTRPCTQTNAIVIGAYSPSVCDQLISILKEVGIKRALSPFGMVEGEDPSKGMDEFSVCGPTRVVELMDGKIQEYIVTPKDFGLKTRKFSEIMSGKNAHENAMRIMNVLNGEYDTADADFFCMNGASALYLCGIAKDFKQGVEMAKEAIINKKALEKFKQLREIQGT